MLVVMMRDTQQFIFATLPFLASTQLHTRFLLRFLKPLSIMIVNQPSIIWQNASPIHRVFGFSDHFVTPR